jgi:hypothetical protein
MVITIAACANEAYAWLVNSQECPVFGSSNGVPEKAPSID